MFFSVFQIFFGFPLRVFGKYGIMNLERMVINMSALQTNLKQILKDKGMTQTQLADAIGISKGTLSDWLSGRYYPRGKYLQAMCDYLGVTMGELVSEKKDTTQLDAEIVTLYTGLSDEKKQQVIDYARYLLHKNK